jgi:hypothetical protein
MHWKYVELMELPYPFNCANNFVDYGKVKLKGINYVELQKGFCWENCIVYFDEEILNKFGFTKDIYTDDYEETWENLYNVFRAIKKWKIKIVNESRISYYITDVNIVSKAWNEMLKYAIDTQIEIDLFKILYSLFEESKYQMFFRDKGYFLFEIVDAKCKFDKAIPDGYIKDIIMKAFEQEIEDSHKTQYTYSIIDIINLGR